MKFKTESTRTLECCFYVGLNKLQYIDRMDMRRLFMHNTWFGGWCLAGLIITAK